MGVKLAPLVTKHPVAIEELRNKTIGLDFSNVIFQFLSSIRQLDGTPLMDSKGKITSHLMGILTRFTNLMEKGLRLVVVLDGKAPALKSATHTERRARKEEAQEKYNQAKEQQNIELMHRYSKQLLYLTDEMLEEAKQLVNALGIPCIQSPQEADAQLAYLNKNEEITCVASNDYDCLLFGTPKLLLNLTLSQKRKLSSGKVIQIQPEAIILSETLSSLGITQEQLISLGILVGTDYHPGVHGIGPKKALKIVKEQTTPAAIFHAAHFEGNWKEIMELFTHMKTTAAYKLVWKEPDRDQLTKLLVKKHDFAEERVDKLVSRLHKKKDDREQAGLSSWVQ